MLGTNIGSGSTVSNYGWNGAINDSFLDDLFKGVCFIDAGDTLGWRTGLLLFNLAGWWGYILYNRIII
jgi:hypothetical protein